MHFGDMVMQVCVFLSALSAYDEIPLLDMLFSQEVDLERFQFVGVHAVLFALPFAPLVCRGAPLGSLLLKIGLVVSGASRSNPLSILAAPVALPRKDAFGSLVDRFRRDFQNCCVAHLTTFLAGSRIEGWLEGGDGKAPRLITTGYRAGSYPTFRVE